MHTERPDAPAPERSRSDRSDGARHLTGALPVTGGVLLIGAAAALISPAIRHEIAQSFQRQSAPYVELYFADLSTARNCPASAGQLRVVATLDSHLAGPADLRYTVQVTRPAGTQVSAVDGVVATTPDRPADFGADVRVPASAYTVRVTLTGRPEQLVLHCGATT